MGWSSDETQFTKKGMATSSKILLAIIACVLLIIILIIALLMSTESSTYTISVDGQAITTVTKDTLLTKINNVTYVNIEEFAKLIKNEYHQGEYKAYTIEKDKCYVQGKHETATFYLNESKVLKLPTNNLNEEYQEYVVESPIKEDKNGKMYAPLDAIAIAFNVQITETQNSLVVFSLDYLVAWYNAKVIEWGYTGISDLSFENQKTLLYDRFIVRKENGLYKIIDGTQKEIVSDKYTEIEFFENTKEFFVTNNLGQVGIINLDGTIKIEPIYESISVLDKELNLYLIKKDEKNGIIKGGNITIVNPEYDSIGVMFNSEREYIILDTLIPVYKNQKWGAFDINGNLVYNIEYDGFGCNLTTVDINGTKKAVNPVIAIQQCNGIIVKKDNKYGVLNLKGENVIPIQVDSIYSIENTRKEMEYFMIYNNQELNIIEMLIEQGIIENTNPKEEINNTIINKNTVNQVSNNTISNNVLQ